MQHAADGRQAERVRLKLISRAVTVIVVMIMTRRRWRLKGARTVEERYITAGEEISKDNGDGDGDDDGDDDDDEEEEEEEGGGGRRKRRC